MFIPTPLEIQLLEANVSAEYRLAAVTRPLSAAIKAAHEQLIDAGPPKDPEDLDEVYRLNDSIGVFLGAQLIAGQRFLTHVVGKLATLAKSVEVERPGEWDLPKSRREILNDGPKLVSEYTLASALDHCANYYKHESEWGTPWELNNTNKITIAAVRALGADENTRNISGLMQRLGAIEIWDFAPISKGLDVWRESLLSRALITLQRLGLAPTLTELPKGH